MRLIWAVDCSKSVLPGRVKVKAAGLEEEALKGLAAHLLSLPGQALNQALLAGELTGVDCNAQD
jgi:hypothetical protein